MSDQEIRLRWEENGSPKYDGITQDITRKYLTNPDSVAVGDRVMVRWGKRGKVWKAVVVDLLEDDDGKH